MVCCERCKRENIHRDNLFFTNLTCCHPLLPHVYTFPIKTQLNLNLGSVSVGVVVGTSNQNPGNVKVSLGLKYSTYIFLTFSGLWIIDGGSYVFTRALWDFSTLPSTKNSTLFAQQQEQKFGHLSMSLLSLYLCLII